MPASHAVALADFDRERRERAQRALEGAGFQVAVFENGQDLLEHVRAQPPDAVVCDILLPRCNGFEVAKALKAESETAAVKVLLILDEGDAYGRNRGRLCGADSILERPLEPEGVARAVGTALEDRALEASGAAGDEPVNLDQVISALESRARAENPLLEHITDSLTGLYNLAFTELKLADEFKKVRRFYHPLTCVLVGLEVEGDLSEPESAQDFRKVVNEVAGILLCESRDIDHLARSSPREFACVLPHTDTPGGVAMAERILASIAGRGFRIAGQEGPVQAAAGVASYSGTGMEAPEELLERAREALGTSRRWGGGRCTVWTAEGRAAPGTEA